VLLLCEWAADLFTIWLIEGTFDKTLAWDGIGIVVGRKLEEGWAVVGLDLVCNKFSFFFVIYVDVLVYASWGLSHSENSKNVSLASASKSSRLIIATTRDYFTAKPHLCRNLFKAHVSTNLNPKSSISLNSKSMLKSYVLTNSYLWTSLWPAKLNSYSIRFASAVSTLNGSSSLADTV